MMAQIPSPTPVQLMGWLGCLAFVLVIFNQAARAWSVLHPRKNEISPQPLEVRAAVEWVTQTEFRQRKAELEDRSNGMEKQLADLRLERNEDVKLAAISRKGMYEKIDTVREEMSEMERRLNAANEARLEKVHERINQVLEGVAELRGGMSG